MILLKNAVRSRWNVRTSSVLSVARAVALAMSALAAPATASAQAVGELNVVQTLRIDGEQADLVPILRLAVSRTGTIAAMQHFDYAVRLFGSDGSSIGSFGRNGAGPGEFRGLASMGWSGDTLWVLDGRLGRFTLVSQGADLLGTVPGPTQARPSAGNAAGFSAFRSIRAVARLRDGSMIVRLVPAETPTGIGGSNSVSLYVHLTADGSILNMIASVPDGTNDERFGYFHFFPDGSRRGRDFPFVARPQYDVSPDGQRFVVVTVGGASPATAEVRIHAMGANGDTIYAKAYRVPSTAIPRSVVDSAMAAVVNNMRQPPEFGSPAWTSTALRAAAAEWEDRARANMAPFYMPVEGRSIIGLDGSVWLRLRESQQGRPYLVLDAQGNAIGRAVFPRNVTILAGDVNTTWGVQLDEYDLPSIVRYQISMPQR